LEVLAAVAAGLADRGGMRAGAFRRFLVVAKALSPPVEETCV